MYYAQLVTPGPLLTKNQIGGLGKGRDCPSNISTLDNYDKQTPGMIILIRGLSVISPIYISGLILPSEAYSNHSMIRD